MPPYLESSSQQVLCSCTLVPASGPNTFFAFFEGGKKWLEAVFIPEMQWKYVRLVEILKTSFDSDQKRLTLRLFGFRNQSKRVRTAEPELFFVSAGQKDSCFHFCLTKHQSTIFRTFPRNVTHWNSCLQQDNHLEMVLPKAK